MHGVTNIRLDTMLRFPREVLVSRISYIWCSLAALLLAGCSVSSEGFFDVSGVTDHESCFDAMFPFEPRFLTSRERQGSAGLFMQSAGGNFQDADVVYMEIYDRENVDTGVQIDFSRPGVLEAAAIGEIQMGRSCPDLIESLYLQGGVVFEQFDTAQDGFVEGRLENASIWSARSDEQIAGTIEGEFLIEVRVGPPYEEFYVIQ